MGLLSGLQILPHGGYAAEIGNDLGYYLDDVVYLLHRVVFADGQTERAVGDLVGQAQGQQHMAGVEGAGGAGRAGGCADALGVQQKQEALALDALKAHIDGAGNVVLQGAVDLAVGDLAQLGEELVPHGDDLRGVFLHVVYALLERRPR